MGDKCQWCGADGHPTNYGYQWDCWTEEIKGSVVRGTNCYEAEIAGL